LLGWRSRQADTYTDVIEDDNFDSLTEKPVLNAGCAQRLANQTGLPCGTCYLARDFGQPLLYGEYHRLALDTYRVQHSSNVESTKSLAAHLFGLCGLGAEQRHKYVETVPGFG
jgi:hypothetical protein